MCKYLSVIVLFACITSVAHAQPIEVYKTFGGVQFERDSLTISTKQVAYLLYENPEAYKLFKTARSNATVASLLAFSGALLIGVPLGSALIGGSDPEWGFALGGAAIMATSIPFNKAFQRQTISALDIYNQKHSSKRRTQVEIFWAGTVAGIRLKL
jgi:hypothetical protein